MPPEVIDVGKIEKSKMSEVHVAAKIYDNKPQVDVRLFVYYTEADAMIPTKKGVSVAPSAVPKLIELLKEAQKKVAELVQ